MRTTRHSGRGKTRTWTGLRKKSDLQFCTALKSCVHALRHISSIKMRQRAQATYHLFNHYLLSYSSMVAILFSCQVSSNTLVIRECPCRELHISRQSVISFICLTCLLTVLWFASTDPMPMRIIVNPCGDLYVYHSQQGSLAEAGTLVDRSRFRCRWGCAKVHLSSRSIYWFPKHFDESDSPPVSQLRVKCWWFTRISLALGHTRHMSFKPFRSSLWQPPTPSLLPLLMTRLLLFLRLASDTHCRWNPLQQPPLPCCRSKWDQDNRAAPEQRPKLTYIILVELLTYQFASPVRRIEAQDLLFKTLELERLIKLGPSPTLTRMTSRALKAKYEDRDDSVTHPQQVQVQWSTAKNS